MTPAELIVHIATQRKSPAGAAVVDAEPGVVRTLFADQIAAAIAGRHTAAERVVLDVLEAICRSPVGWPNDRAAVLAAIAVARNSRIA